MAQIYFGLTNPSFPVQSTFAIGVFLDSHEQSLAAVEGSLKLPDNLSLLAIEDGDSVINLWLERPEIGDREVAFSGMIPGGFVGDRGSLFTLIVRAQTVGEVTLDALDTRILLNDGLGTDAEVIPAPLTFSISESGEPTTYSASEDTEPPEPFTPMLLERDELGGWVVVFSTQDKISGLDRYEIREGKLDWKPATSPYRLQDQQLRQRISVKAVDRAGNERVAIVPATHPLPGYVYVVLIGILVVTGVILTWSLFVRKLRKRAFLRKRKR
jgi:hypothetical protein